MTGNTVNYSSNMSNRWHAPMLDFSSTGGGWSVPMGGFGSYGYGGFTPSWGSYGFSGYTSNSNSSAGKSSQTPNINASTNFQGLTKNEEKLITDYSTKKQECVEHLGPSLAFGTGLGVGLSNTDKIKHPISAVQCAFKKDSMVNMVFNKNVCKGDLWKNQAGLMQEAYAELYRAEIRHQKWAWQGLLKRGFTDDEILKLSAKLEKAIASGQSDEVIKAVAELKAANSIKGGHLPSFWSRIKGWFGGNKPTVTSIDDVMNNTKLIDSNIKTVQTMTNVGTYKGALKSSLGGKMGWISALVSIGCEYKYIKAGFQQDSGTGLKQLGQSVAKSLSSWGGWILGEAAGKWAGAKLGASIGTAICPGLGSAIGAVAGFVLGAVCSWGLRKLTNWAVGDNVVNKYIAKNEIKEAKTKEEKGALISNLIMQAEKDKNIDEKTAAALVKAQQLYCVA